MGQKVAQMGRIWAGQGQIGVKKSIFLLNWQFWPEGHVAPHRRSGPSSSATLAMDLEPPPRSRGGAALPAPPVVVRRGQPRGMAGVACGRKRSPTGVQRIVAKSIISGFF